MIQEKIKDHFENKKFSRITRTIGNGQVAISRGYIVSYSTNFLILQVSDDFRLLEYTILPISKIKTIRFNKNDQYYNKIMIWEGEHEKVGIDYNIDLCNWVSIFKSLKKTGLNVVVECEGYVTNVFNIGPIIKTTQTKIYIHYFDATGFFDEKPTPIEFQNITVVGFNDRYTNIFGKYLKHRKK